MKTCRDVEELKNINFSVISQLKKVNQVQEYPKERAFKVTESISSELTRKMAELLRNENITELNMEKFANLVFSMTKIASEFDRFKEALLKIIRPQMYLQNAMHDYH